MTNFMSLWAPPFGVGFALSFSLILAIGAQNAFVLRQGLMRQHIGPLVLFCAASDAFLIIVGVGGLAKLLSHWLEAVERWLFAGAATWLMIYGLMRGYSAWIGAAEMKLKHGKHNSLASTLAMAAILTFGNPHVYLDTVVLIGAVSLQFESAAKFAFACGAASASFIFFSVLGYGAVKLSGIIQRPHAWRILDAFVSLVMFTLAFSLAQAGGWI